MIDRMYGKRTVEQVTTIYEEIACDVCHAVIRKRIFDNAKCELVEKEDARREYYRVVTGHHDWGNDSVDSIGEAHCCSGGCLRQMLDNYILNSSGHQNTEYMEIYHCDEG